MYRSQTGVSFTYDIFFFEHMLIFQFETFCKGKIKTKPNKYLVTWRRVIDISDSLLKLFSVNLPISEHTLEVS